MNDITSLFNELNSSYAEFDTKKNKKNSANVRKILMSIKIECATLRQSILNQVKKKVVEPVASELQVEALRPVETIAPVEALRPVAQVEEKKKKEKKIKIDKVEKKTRVKFSSA